MSQRRPIPRLPAFADDTLFHLRAHSTKSFGLFSQVLSSNKNLTPGVDLSRSRAVGIPMSEVAKHSSPQDCWTVIDGFVYNLTPFLDYHPGGRAILVDSRVAGKDSTEYVQKYHRWVDTKSIMSTLVLGPVTMN